MANTARATGEVGAAPPRFPFMVAAGLPERARAASLEQLYGSAAAMARDFDLQMLSQFGRLPGSGLESSLLGLRSMAGELDDCAWPELNTSTSSGAVSLARACRSNLPGPSCEEGEVSAFNVVHASIEKEMGLAPMAARAELGDTVLP